MLTFLDKNTFDKTVDLLMPYMTDYNSRQAFVIQALYSSEELRSQIEFSGSATSFTTLLVQKCSNFGLIDSDLLAVVALLDELQRQAGEEKRERINELIIQIKNRYSTRKNNFSSSRFGEVT